MPGGVQISLGGEIADSIIASNKGIAIDAAYDEMISELLDEFPILGWRIFLLNCLNDEIADKNNSAVTNTTTTLREVTYRNNIIAPQGCYYYGLPGEEHDQALISTKLLNTRGMFLTNSLRNAIDSSMNFTENSLHILFDTKR